MLIIRKSICGQYVRVSIANVEVEMTLGEWSRLVARPGEFVRSTGR